MATPIRSLGDARSHARWLHELRNVVSTASVAASMGRRLVRDDPQAAAEVMVEAERALSACRDLLATAAEHVCEDPSSESLVRALIRREPGAAPTEPRRAARRRGDAGRPVQPRSRASSACLSGSPQR
ncbi:hypothetical protein [Cognatilysobacter segetis]|uniref:hypothetical protein n=1 Tax=Cognatilysobacter segetis TaxID=2492394 RepID=UPI001061859D|nr:hypothetical protein [Lysobacter segetis]